MFFSLYDAMWPAASSTCPQALPAIIDYNLRLWPIQPLLSLNCFVRIFYHSNKKIGWYWEFQNKMTPLLGWEDCSVDRSGLLYKHDVLVKNARNAQRAGHSGTSIIPACIPMARWEMETREPSKDRMPAGLAYAVGKNGPCLKQLEGKNWLSRLLSCFHTSHVL